jgi:hypothetical protein
VDYRCQFDQPRASPEPAELHRRRTHASVHTGYEVGTPFDGYRDFISSGCRNTPDIPIEPLGSADRRQHCVGDVLAYAHRHLEQIAGVVSLNFSLDDYSYGARGRTVGTEKSRRELLRAEIEFPVCDERQPLLSDDSVGTPPRHLSQNAAVVSLSAGYEQFRHCTVKVTVPTVALTEPDVPATMIV